MESATAHLDRPWAAAVHRAVWHTRPHRRQFRHGGGGTWRLRDLTGLLGHCPKLVYIFRTDLKRVRDGSPDDPLGLRGQASGRGHQPVANSVPDTRHPADTNPLVLIPLLLRDSCFLIYQRLRLALESVGITGFQFLPVRVMTFGRACSQVSPLRTSWRGPRVGFEPIRLRRVPA